MGKLPTRNQNAAEEKYLYYGHSNLEMLRPIDQIRHIEILCIVSSDNIRIYFSNKVSPSLQKMNFRQYHARASQQFSKSFWTSVILTKHSRFLARSTEQVVSSLSLPKNNMHSKF